MYYIAYVVKIKTKTSKAQNLWCSLFKNRQYNETEMIFSLHICITYLKYVFNLYFPYEVDYVYNLLVKILNRMILTLIL